MDGGHALLQQTSKLLPLVNVQRCARHVLDDMVKNREATVDRGHYATLINMPAGRRKHAEAIYAKISMLMKSTTRRRALVVPAR